MAGVAAEGGHFSKLGESVVDCRGAETEASPPSTAVGSAQDTVEVESCPCTVNPCICVCGEIASHLVFIYLSSFFFSCHYTWYMVVL